MSLTLLLFFSSWFSPQVAIALDNEQEVSIHQYYLCDLFVSTRLDEGGAHFPELLNAFIALPEVFSEAKHLETNWNRSYPEKMVEDVVREISWLESRWSSLDTEYVSTKFLRSIWRKMGGAEAYKSLLRDAQSVLLTGASNARKVWLSNAQNILSRLRLNPASVSMGDLLTLVWLNSAIQDPLRVFALVDDVTAQYYKEYNRAGHSPSGVTEYLLRIGREQLDKLRENVDRRHFFLLIPKRRLPSLRTGNFSIGLPIAWISINQPVENFYDAIENAAWVAESIEDFDGWSVKQVFENYVSIQDAYSHALYLAEDMKDPFHGARVERVIDYIFRRFLFEGSYTRAELLSDLQTYLGPEGVPIEGPFKWLYYEIRDRMALEDDFRGGSSGAKLRMGELRYALAFTSFALKSDKIRAEGQRGLRLQKRPI